MRPDEITAERSGEAKMLLRDCLDFASYSSENSLF